MKKAQFRVRVQRKVFEFAGVFHSAALAYFALRQNAALRAHTKIDDAAKIFTVIVEILSSV